jgi:hypothetical protein
MRTYRPQSQPIQSLEVHIDQRDAVDKPSREVEDREKW